MTRRRALRMGALLILAGLLGVAIPVALASGWGSTAVQLSADTGVRTQEAPAVSLSPSGNVAAIWLADSATDTTATTAQLEGSFDSGHGFSGVTTVAGQADPLATSDGDDYPQVSQDTAGDTLAVWINNRSLVAAYRAVGQTDFIGSTVDDTSSSGATDALPQLAMDPAGDAVVVWQQQSVDTGGWAVYYAVLTAGATSFDAPVQLASGLPSGGAEPSPHVAINSSGAAAIVWIDTYNTAVDYSYTPDAASTVFGVTEAGYTAGGGYQLATPVVAVAGDGNVAVAWDQGGDSQPNNVWEGDLPKTVAEASAPFDNPGAIGSGADSGSALGSTDQEDPSIAMKSAAPGDDTTALGFWDGAHQSVAAFIRPSGSYDQSWSSFDNSTLWATPDQDWLQESVGDFPQQSEIALASTAASEDGPLTMVWTGGGSGTDVDSITSDASGSFAGSQVQTIESGGDVSQFCAGSNNACVQIAANPGGDVAALWQQNDSSTTPHVQVVADCYQASAAPVTSTTDHSGCDSLTQTTTTATTTTATTTTTTTTPTTTTQTTETQSTATGSQTPPAPSPTAATATSPTASSTTPTIFSPTTTGTVLVKLAGSNKFVAVQSNAPIPNGSVIDATNGTVQLTFKLPDGSTETASFWGGQFAVTITPGGAVKLKLVGGSFSGCPRPGRHRGHTASAARSKKPSKKKPGSAVRSLWSNAKGNFTTTGQNGAATVLGTTWLVRDQCNGTYFYVKSTSNDPNGAILVTVLHPHRHTVKLKHGHSLLAPAPGF